jgi:hypothetical protein
MSLFLPSLYGCRGGGGKREREKSKSLDSLTILLAPIGSHGAPALTSIMPFFSTLSILFSCEDGNQYVPPNHQLTSARLHTVMPQKTVFFQFNDRMTNFRDKQKMWIHRLPKLSYTVPSANCCATLIRNNAVLIPDIFMHIFYV